MTKEITKANECYSCANMRRVKYNCHIRCAKPDPELKGSQHGIKNGWFIYPLLVDPVWKLNMCNNYESKLNNVAVSGPVSVVGNSK